MRKLTSAKKNGCANFILPTREIVETIGPITASHVCNDYVSNRVKMLNIFRLDVDMKTNKPINIYILH